MTEQNPVTEPATLTEPGTVTEQARADLRDPLAARDVDEAVARLRAAVLRLAQALRAPATGHGLTPSRLAGMVVLANEGPVRVGDFARRLGVTAASASRLVDVLVESGMTERVDDPTDQRACLLAATQRGRQAIEDVRRAGLEQLLQHVAELPEDEGERLLAAIPALERLADSVHDAAAG